MSILKPVCPHCGYVPDEEFGHTIGTEVMCPQCRSNFTIEDPEKANGSKREESLVVSCKGCAKTFNVPTSFAGRSAKCPGCDSVLKVPSVGASEPPKDEDGEISWSRKYLSLRNSYPDLELVKTDNPYLDLVIGSELNRLLDSQTSGITPPTDGNIPLELGPFRELSVLLELPNSKPNSPTEQEVPLERLRAEVLQMFNAEGLNESFEVNEILLRLAYQVHVEEEFERNPEYYEVIPDAKDERASDYAGAASVYKLLSQYYEEYVYNNPQCSLEEWDSNPYRKAHERFYEEILERELPAIDP